MDKRGGCAQSLKLNFSVVSPTPDSSLDPVLRSQRFFNILTNTPTFHHWIGPSDNFSEDYGYTFYNSILKVCFSTFFMMPLGL